jgi:hypothetical protein
VGFSFLLIWQAFERRRCARTGLLAVVKSRLWWDGRGTDSLLLASIGTTCNLFHDGNLRTLAFMRGDFSVRVSIGDDDDELME